MQRRSFLGLGMTAGMAALGRRAQGAPPPAVRTGRAKQVLVVMEQGGVSHLDTWDPKPEAPTEQRSPYHVIDTAVPGMQFTELLAKTARHAGKLAVVRSMTHNISGHGEGTAYVLQGVKPGGVLDMPDLGAAVSQVCGTQNPYLPSYVMIPGNGEQSGVATPGFLSPGLKAFKTGGRDISDPKWRVNDLDLLGGVDLGRFHHRRDLLSNLDIGLLKANGGTSAKAMGNYFDQAFQMLDNPQTRAAFDLQREPESVRQAYGLGHRGQAYLLGRKMIESGVKFVVLDVREPETKTTPGGFNMNWDHHDLIYSTGSCGTVRDKAGGEGRYGISHWVMMGSTDQAFAALLDDLDQRGLLAETLVCFVTEFGRTPKINKFQGRDHWPYAYSIAFAGAGVRGGQIIGKTDKEGGYVLDEAYTPDDYAATVYDFVGVELEHPIYTRERRPVFLSPEGRVITKLT
jgi:hypothetical protein